MPATIIEKIIAAHAGGGPVAPGDTVEFLVDTRVARDFGGANVVRNLIGAGLDIADPTRTFFTFDCNPCGSDQLYAANQQHCRVFAGARGIRVFDIDRGIGTHTVIEEGLIRPGGTMISTDSHANIMGALGAFGQGMGDTDIAAAFATGRIWFRVPPTVRIQVTGLPHGSATAKDLTLAIVGQLGSRGLLGKAAEFYGEAIDALDVAGRITLASMATEMGAIITFIPPDERVLAFVRDRTDEPVEPVYADADATYAEELRLDVAGLLPQVARPGRPEDVQPVHEAGPVRIDSAFIGSCTNGRIEDLRAAARVLEGRRTAPGVVLKIVPATDEVWRQCMAEGLLAIFKEAGVLFSNAGCAGCAAGQVGQNGPGEATVSSGNRNFRGKQGQGQVWLASPETVAASAVAGVLISAPMLAAGEIPARPGAGAFRAFQAGVAVADGERSEVLCGAAYVVDRDDIDTDMIYHNQHLAETDPARMGRHTFGNLEGHRDFPARVRPGTIVFSGHNFGCGSSRQQAVDCFRALGVSAVVARSFGAIYERNAINTAFPVIPCDWPADAIQTGDELRIDLATGRIDNLTRQTTLEAPPLPPVQLAIYKRGGLLVRGG